MILPSKSPLLLSSVLFLSTAHSATVTYDFDVGWTTANPDGAWERPVVGINGQWPIPRISANVGDRVVVNLHNSLGNQSTSLHFHGLFQNGTTHMDGPTGVVQCDVPPGHNFTYNFTVAQPGTYWYHSHTRGQYPDGLRGPLVVHDPDSPFRGRYDHELVLTVSDWYHDQMADLLPGFISKQNPTGAEPVPDAALWNETQNLTVPVQPGQTYLFRVANVGAFAGQYIWFEGHNMSVVEVDGVYTQPAEAELIYLSAAQRCSFLVTMRNDTSANFPFVASMDTSLFDTLPDDLNWNVTGWLVYDAANANPEPALVAGEFNEFDDFTLVPYDNQALLTQPDQDIELEVIMDNLGDGANYAFFNNITYKTPKVPTLYTVLSAGDLATTAAIYGDYTHAFVLARGQVVQVVVDNADTGKHPFHLHGHNFQVVWRSDEDAGLFADSNVTEADFPPVPMKRDTVVLNPMGFMVLRFVADNPGVWFFHCHIQWHLDSGLAATFIEAPLELQQSLLATGTNNNNAIPADHYAACAAATPHPTPTVGNAAGHTKNLLDLSGQPSPPARLPPGFTPRGIVALVFSCVSGCLGVAVVAWYGLVGGGGDGGGGGGAGRTTAGGGGGGLTAVTVAASKKGASGGGAAATTNGTHPAGDGGGGGGHESVSSGASSTGGLHRRGGGGAAAEEAQVVTVVSGGGGGGGYVRA